MDNKLDLFLVADNEVTGEVNMKRFGIKFEIKGFTEPELKELREQAKYDGVLNDSEFYCLMVANGVTSPNLNDPKVIAKYKARDGADVIEKAFLAGEIMRLRDAILKLSGFDEDESIEEAKN